jgi:hypothetical protein
MRGYVDPAEQVVEEAGALAISARWASNDVTGHEVVAENSP